MIQIDDAGSGSLIGGTCIGAIRVETGEYYYKIIPIEYYSKKSFKKKLYLEYVVDIIEDLFEKLDVPKDEPIEVCRGYMFDRLRKWFNKENYIYKSVKIEEPLQSRIEKSFEEYAISLGLPEDFITYTKYPFHFHTLLKWVYADKENRIKICKRGWKSWDKYGNLETTITIDKVLKNTYLCLKCGKKILEGNEIKKIEYISNRPTSVFIHANC